MPNPEVTMQYSFADYLTWLEDERWELVDGVPYLQATPTPLHQDILGGIFAQFFSFLQGKECKVYVAPFCVRLADTADIPDEAVNQVVEPDISVVCDQTKIDPKGCKGAPDLIVEIISPSSVKRDRFIKFNLYEKAGVKEYWLVEPEAKLVSVFVLQDNQRYGRPEVFAEDGLIAVNIFPTLTVDLSLVFPV